MSSKPTMLANTIHDPNVINAPMNEPLLNQNQVQDQDHDQDRVQDQEEVQDQDQDQNQDQVEIEVEGDPDVKNQDKDELDEKHTDDSSDAKKKPRVQSNKQNDKSKDFKPRGFKDRAQNQPVTDYTLNEQDEKVKELVLGYLEEWQNSDGSSESMAMTYGEIWSGKADALTLGWALLAAVDDLQIKCQTDKTQVPILKRILGTGDIELARSVLRISEPLTNTYHRVYVKKRQNESEANNETNNDNKQTVPYSVPSPNEYKTTLNDASVWTLAKFLRCQVCAGVNRCFPRRLHGLPLVSHVVEPSLTLGKIKVVSKDKQKEKDKNKDKNKEKEKRDYNDKKSTSPAQYCLVDEAAWDGNLVYLNLIDALNEIKDSYNRILNSTLDFSDAYTAAGRLRREANQIKRNEDREVRNNARKDAQNNRNENGSINKDSRNFNKNNNNNYKGNTRQQQQQSSNDSHQATSEGKNKPTNEKEKKAVSVSIPTAPTVIPWKKTGNRRNVEEVDDDGYKIVKKNYNSMSKGTKSSRVRVVNNNNNNNNN